MYNFKFLNFSLIFLFVLMFCFPINVFASSSFQISETDIVLEVGDIYEVTYSGADYEVVWAFDTEVAYAIDGKVYAVKSGTGILYVYNGNDYVTCNVTVNDAKNSTLNKTNVNLNVGKTENLSVLGTNKQINWESTDDNIAIVDDDGLITAINNGNCIINAKINDNTLSCNITVGNYVLTDSKEPTCTENGYEFYQDENSSNTYTDTIPALGHDYIDVVVPPTCTEGGYTTHTCSRCGDTYNDTITSAKGHTYGNFVETVAPADFNTFGKANMVCPDCGEILYADLDVVLLDLGNGNTAKVYGYYDRTEAETCFDLTLQYKVDNGFYYEEDGYVWNEDKYNFSCIRVAENAYEFNDLLDITHTRLNGKTSLGCGENIACHFSSGDSNINNIHYTSSEVFQSWLDSELHRDNIEQAYMRMSSAKFTAWIPDGHGWCVFWVQTFN